MKYSNQLNETRIWNVDTSVAHMFVDVLFIVTVTLNTEPAHANSSKVHCIAILMTHYQNWIKIPWSIETRKVWVWILCGQVWMDYKSYLKCMAFPTPKWVSFESLSMEFSDRCWAVNWRNHRLSPYRVCFTSINNFGYSIFTLWHISKWQLLFYRSYCPH